MAQALPQAVGSVQYYLNHIAQYDREFKKWEGRAEKIIRKYKDEGRSDRNSSSRFNILWSNVQTLKAATFSRLPKPDVSRRYKDNDPVGRVASLMIERALEFEVDHYPDFHDSLKHAVYDRFLGGRGCAWVRYEPVFTQEQDGTDEEQVTEDVETESQVSEELDYECAPTDYVHWRDFGHSIARTWEEVSIIWRKVYLTRDALEERFGEEAKNVPLDSSPQDKTNKTDPDGVGSRALVYEIWDKDTGCAYWLSKSKKDFLDEQEDPLGLEEFFPCPRPLYATVTNDKLEPIPDFALYQDQAAQLDLLSDRIDGLVKALQVRGIYDAAVPELARLFSEGTNTSLLPVKNWAAFAEKQGLKGAIDLVDLQPIASALNECYAAFKAIKDQIYELTGIADIIRGETMASETATAQGIKDKYATLRLKTYQDEVARYATDLLRLKAEIICNHFDPQTILKMSGAAQFTQEDQQYIPQAIAMLKDSVLRNFRINVAADSLLYLDENQEKQDRMEFLAATSGFIEKLVQAGQVAPQVLTLGVDMLKFGVTGFRVGKGLEGVIDSLADQLRDQAKQPKPPAPDPEQVKAQAAQQSQQMTLQAKQQGDAMQIQHEKEMETFRQQAQQAQFAQQSQIESQRNQMQAEHEYRLEEMRQQHAAYLKQQELDAQQAFDRWKAELDANTKIVVAEIAAKTSLQTTAMSASAKSDTTDVAEDGTTKTKSGLTGLVDSMNQNMEKLMQAHQDSHKEIVAVLSKPKQVIRGSDGRVSGVA
jgi:hypothetical protein